MSKRPLILITNDDGIDSPGLHASASAVVDLGELLIVAPSSQQTSSGRSFPPIVDKAVYQTKLLVNGEKYLAYKAAVSPAQAVALAIYDLAKRPIDLCISGINYGENIGSGVTISGTVGAAMEASASGVPALAMSLETPPEYHLTYSQEIDFTTAAYFTRYFAQQILAKGLPENVDLLKIDIPTEATPETPWQMARISRQRYYNPVPSGRLHLEDQAAVGYQISFDSQTIETDSDVYVMVIDKQIAVVPMTLDLTARVSLTEIAQLYR